MRAKLVALKRLVYGRLVLWTAPALTDTLIYPQSDGVLFLESLGPKEDSDAPQVPHRGSPSGDRASSIGHENSPARRDLRHERRHTFASLLIDSGANPKAIQDFMGHSMGHSKIQMTFDVYGHLLPGSRDEVRKRMDAYLHDDGECQRGA